MYEEQNKKRFKIGDTVRLMSGGPIMTVEEAGQAEIKCQWFAGKKLEYGYFPVESLNKVEVNEE